MAEIIFKIFKEIINIINTKSIEIISFILMIAGIIGVIYSLIKFVDHLVNQKLEHPTTIKKITGLIRPIVIFTSKEIILADQGAMEYIESFNVAIDQEDKHMPRQIIINFKKNIHLQPILESIGPSRFEIKATKGKHYQWSFDLKPIDISDLKY